MDCRGVTGVVFGSLLAVLIRRGSLGANQHQRLAYINQWMKSWYDENTGTPRLPLLKLENLVLSNWAELHGPAIKAANSRHAAPLFAALARECCTEPTSHDEAVIEVTSRLEEFYDILDTASMFLTPRQQQTLSLTCEKFGVAFQRLRMISATRGQLRWQVKPKLHKMMHWPLFSAVINPKRVGCYGDESQIGSSCQVWKRCVSGRYEKIVQRNVLLKRWVALLLRLYELAHE